MKSLQSAAVVSSGLTFLQTTAKSCLVAPISQKEKDRTNRQCVQGTDLITGPLVRRSSARLQRTTVVLILGREWGLAKAWEDQKQVSLFCLSGESKKNYQILFISTCVGW